MLPVALVNSYPLSRVHCISLQSGAQLPYPGPFGLTKHTKNRDKPGRGVRGTPSQWEAENQNFWLKKILLGGRTRLHMIVSLRAEANR